MPLPFSGSAKRIIQQPQNKVNTYYFSIGTFLFGIFIVKCRSNFSSGEGNQVKILSDLRHCSLRSMPSYMPLGIREGDGHMMMYEPGDLPAEITYH